MKEVIFKQLRDLAESRTVAANVIHTQEGRLLAEQGLLSGNGITPEGERQLAPYKVDNAIIMAAGYSARCMPLSNVMPKGLFKVKGEILIEREIRQLLEAGVTEIVVVTGFMAEKFDYLQEKYGVTLVLNKDFDKYNNMATLYAAQAYMKIRIFCAQTIIMRKMYSINMFMCPIIPASIRRATATSFALRGRMKTDRKSVV